MTTCSLIGCGKVASCAPMILLPAPVQYQDAPPVQIIVGLPLCAECGSRLQPGEVVSRADLDKFADAIAASGKVRPEPERARITTIALDHPDYMAMHTKRAEAI